jgi:gamma-glutamyltranspeptidase/glutathione hydrolase
MFTTRPEIMGTFGVVASTHWLASATGMAILEKGGNAFDAAVAAGFALQVVEPHLNGPAGDMPLLFHSARAGGVQVLCGQGTLPAGATMAHYRGLGLDLVPGTGLLATVVPGVFDAWMTLLRDHGTMRVADVLAPAIGFADDGYALVPRIADAISAVAELFRSEWPTSAEIYLKNGRPPAPRTRFRNPLLAQTWRRMIAEAEAAGGDRERQIEAARRAWSQGFVADAIDRFCRTAEVMDSSGRRHKGVLSGADMAGWQASYEAPLTYDYGRYTVCKTGAWGQGPVLLQQLALLKGFDIAAMDPTGPDFVHSYVECAKLAYADREAYYGDSGTPAPMDVLLSDAYNDKRRGLIGPRASLELRPGQVAGHGARLVAARGASGQDAVAGAGEPTVRRLGAGEPTVARDGRVSGDTCHLDVIDRHGNMVSATPSGGWLQSSPAIPGLGFCLNTRAQMFWLEEGLPTSLAPGKRPRTTLSPSFALRDGEPYMAFGTPGGDQQDQWSALLLLHHADHGMNLQQAIDCPAFHSEHFTSSFWPRAAHPGKLVVEGRFPEATVAELRRRGHQVEVGEPWSEGRLSAATRDGDFLKAAANPRGVQGYAIGR